MALTLATTAFAEGGGIPQQYTCEGDDRSPPFEWAGVPEGTESFLLVCDDPDAPGGTFHHWAAYNIPADRRSLSGGYGPETPETDVAQAINDFRSPGYRGPCPPRGHRPHAYHFRLSALNGRITAAGPGAGCVEIQRMARPLEIEAVELIGYYGR
ncbi:YbhB/YbcL family Raf kinase inhibitor-like protein [Microbaculum marinisediminis]|uniref:YbhB/YbcL family Raf kinase inhibitor-like protein n=1 Tax=Microbaculum marinisediminis TaxID=2931392 RepID=A0AAW5R2T3_9HYPH|nr:YbhB/YbcL family Raf kinase inhibitor-like protein [Microbaculum sp. A6E488]MCT8974571.1 YbhB/YbcL family Raf kinase inhibitor-like protein [Microbaculum sp. A6E488]